MLVFDFSEQVAIKYPSYGHAPLEPKNIEKIVSCKSAMLVLYVRQFHLHFNRFERGKELVFLVIFGLLREGASRAFGSREVGYGTARG